METNKEIPTAEEFWEQISPNKEIGMLADLKKLNISTHVFEIMRRFTKIHLFKQAEVIAEKATVGEEGEFNRFKLVVDKQSILQASEEYINNLK